MPIFILYVLALITIPAYAELSLTIDPIHSTETQQTHNQSHATYTVNLHFPLKDGDSLYHDYISVSTDSPDITLSHWLSSCEPIEGYDELFKKNKQVYKEPFTLTLTAQVKTDNGHSLQTPHLHCIYYKKSDNKITHELLPLIFTPEHQHLTPPCIETVPIKGAYQKKHPTQTDASLPTHKKKHSTLPGYKQVLYPLCIILMGILSTIVSTKRVEKNSSTRLTYSKTLVGTVIGMSLLCIYLLNAAF